MRVAVIDLGTNTFHLIIAESDSVGGWHLLSKNKIFVKLAEDGIQHIGVAAFDRGLQAIRVFRTDLDNAQIPLENIRALGTAAFRTADNASDFLDQAAQIIGARPLTIPGEREAELIHKGVCQAVPFPDNRVLMMDIGGGSVEFIIADRKQVFWQKSFPVGVAVLWRAYHKSDPITIEEIQHLENHLETELTDLWLALSRFPCPTLVGASGTFDVIDLFLIDPIEKPEHYGFIPVADFYPLYEKLIASTLSERHAMPLLPDERIEMVVVAVILIHIVLNKAHIREIYTSAYAMKEGMVAELLESVDKG